MTGRLEANRRNALLSTGPRTLAGRKKSSQNATKHGLSALSHPAIQVAGDSSAEPRFASVSDRHRRAQEAAYAALRNLSCSIDSDTDPVGALRRLAALERYRRPFFRAWLRALNSDFSQNEPIENATEADGAP